ncbi:MAG: MerR family transcriptional regulator [Nitrospina sp.]|jgi:methanogenic corrinoid protein MtbC1|nr:MerR family transcriptional regulator [Nitrospina sp.]MBT4374357.1 MerR family transcriptional regulator [Nitrospina sp.]MBT4556438.1 MerR family transcriptional regulator [Nitrospina sp.]MBT6902157.1 MerR family transcriptional regulator [Nitrospina sp.]
MTEVIKMEDCLSIGELSGMTGIGVHTLRVWEKRYGAPHSQRLPSGHRRYPKEEVPRLRAIASALESGYRASKVVTATLEELQNLMDLKPFIESKPDTNADEQVNLASKEILIESWVSWVHGYDDDVLLNSFHDQWGRHGALNFILNFAAPLMERIGKGWETGELDVSHEHFASECLVSFLSEKWRQMNIRKNGPTVLITTLPGELYSLGIIMCAVVTSVTSSKVIYLGVDNPLEDIISTAENYKPEIITMSISHAFDPTTAENLLFKLRSELNSKTSMITGGKGSPCNIPGISYIPSFDKYYDFLSNFNQPEKTKV